MSLRFGILGCGPAGLLAAHAVAMAGFDPVIFSLKQKSKQYGAQWLHREIPLITPDDPESSIEYILEGTPDGYREKVYGNRGEVDVSFGKFHDDNFQDIWDLRGAYSKLWEIYEGQILNYHFTAQSVRDLLEDDGIDYWMSTIPLPTLCAEPVAHKFDSEMVWVSPAKAMEMREYLRDGRNVVVYSGSKANSWYRASVVFGQVSIEYPFRSGQEPPVKGAWPVSKPLTNACTCLPQVRRLGRYGAWTKGVLTHDAFEEAQDFVSEVSFV